MNQPKHISIIYNPSSSGPSKKAAEKLNTQLKNHFKQATIELIPTKRAGHAEEIAYEATKTKEAALIVSVSGDGGYSEVINGMMRAKHAGHRACCAVLAAGNANDHQASVTSHDLYRSIIKDNRRLIDLLKLEVTHKGKTIVRYGHSYIGVGLTPAVAIELNRQKLNALREFWIVISGFYKFQPFEIKSAGKTMVLDSLVASNIGRIAKLIKFEGAEPDDGRFEVTIFKHGHKIKLFWRLIKAVFRGLPPSFETTKFEFTALNSMPVQIDGEVMYLKRESEVTITIDPKALETYV